MLARRLANALSATTWLFLSASTLPAQMLATGDSRKFIPEPHYPMICTTVTAQFSSAQRTAPPSPEDTSRLQAALSSCAGSGKATFPFNLHDDRDEHQDHSAGSMHGTDPGTGLTRKVVALKRIAPWQTYDAL